ILALSFGPRRILAFEHGVAIKYLSYRSRFLPWTTIDVVGLRTLRELRANGELGGCRILALPVREPAFYLRARDGRAWLVRTRDTSELYGVIRRCVDAAMPGAATAP